MELDRFRKCKGNGTLSGRWHGRQRHVVLGALLHVRDDARLDGGGGRGGRLRERGRALRTADRGRHRGRLGRRHRTFLHDLLQQRINLSHCVNKEQQEKFPFLRFDSI